MRSSWTTASVRATGDAKRGGCHGTQVPVHPRSTDQRRGAGLSWEWEVPREGAVAVGGALAALFAHYEPKCPGHLSIDPPDAHATLLAREAVQNSWDAAIEAAGDDEPTMTLEFAFDRLDGDRKDRLIDALALGDLRDRVRLLPADGWQALRLPGPRVFSFANSDKPLEVLRIAETGTTGMYGPWNFDKDVRSKMIFAMLSVGFQKKAGHMAGGSYGQGKAGLINASRTRTVVAYSCFAERDDDPGVTRRLLGVTYWGGHDIGGLTYTGFGKFWAGDNQAFENEEADRVAISLGLDVRVPTTASGFGTSFLIVAPTVEPPNLLRAVERNWWPAIEQFNGFEVQVTDYDGQILAPRPRKDEHLLPYIRAFEIARRAERAEVSKEERFARPNSMTLIKNGNRSTEIGRLGLVGDPEGWSYPSTNDPVAHRSLVALVRGPRMVTEYWEAGKGGRRPYVRGIYIAEGGTVDALLRQTEPPLHNSWDEASGEGGVDDEAPQLAERIHKFVRSNVDQFRNELNPPAPPRDQHHLPDFDQILKDLFKGGRNREALPDPRPRDIHVEPANAQRVAQDPVHPTLIRMEAGCSFSLTEVTRQKLEARAQEEADVRIAVSFRFDEDGRAGSAEDSRATVHLSETVAGFRPTYDRRSLVLTGKLGLDDVISISVHSDGYDPDYAGRTTFTAELITSDSASTGGSDG